MDTGTCPVSTVAQLRYAMSSKETEMIELHPSCMGCGNEIATPGEADMDLFRVGIRIHDTDTCFVLANDKIQDRHIAVIEDTPHTAWQSPS